jgi:ribonuclease Z
MAADRQEAMSTRELIVLGTASQAPTAARNHNGYVLRWDTETILFDPGEGTQRQFIHAGVSSASVTRYCITHFHGDHCLGLPGMILRMSLDQVDRPVPIHYPASGQEYFERLRHATLSTEQLDVRPDPIHADGVVFSDDVLTLRCAHLDHTVPALGWRIDEPDGRRMLPDRLREAGIEGPDVGRILDEGRLRVGGRTITLEEVSEHRPGQSFAFVMDTRWCDAALDLAHEVDLLVCEATFLSGDEDLAAEAGHLTAQQAGRLAAQAGARTLVLSHLSQRYPDPSAFAADAGPEFADVIVAEDLQRIAVPRRA